MSAHLLQAPMLKLLIEHVWQSTLWALCAAAISFLVPQGRPDIRFRIWLFASFKFFFPIAPLIRLGEELRPQNLQFLSPEVLRSVLDGVPSRLVVGPTTGPTGPLSLLTSSVLPMLLLALWLAGSLTLAVLYTREMFRLQRLVATAEKQGTYRGVPLVSVRSIHEPGVFGFVRPVMVLPAGLHSTLNSEQFDAVLAHEACHVQRIDNLWATLHAIVQVAFWFDPVVWWIGAQLVKEREAACDADVIALGHDARIYAEALLTVCKTHLANRQIFTTGITGADLPTRIEKIIARTPTKPLSPPLKLVLGSLVLSVLAVPFAYGALRVDNKLPLYSLHPKAPSPPSPESRPGFRRK